MISNSVNSAALQDEYLTLLVAQLKNQDPLDPVAQEDFVGQLAQFSTLGGVEELNQNFEAMLQLQGELIRLQELTTVSDMVGRTVTYLGADGLSTHEGRVQSVSIFNGRLGLDIGGDVISLGQVLEVGTDATAG